MKGEPGAAYTIWGYKLMLAGILFLYNSRQTFFSLAFGTESALFVSSFTFQRALRVNDKRMWGTAVRVSVCEPTSFNGQTLFA